MRKLHLAAVSDLLDGNDVPHYAYEKSYADAQHDPLFVLHTSGSTGRTLPSP